LITFRANFEKRDGNSLFLTGLSANPFSVSGDKARIFSNKVDAPHFAVHAEKIKHDTLQMLRTCC